MILIGKFYALKNRTIINYQNVFKYITITLKKLTDLKLLIPIQEVR